MSIFIAGLGTGCSSFFDEQNLLSEELDSLLSNNPNFTGISAFAVLSDGTIRTGHAGFSIVENSINIAPNVEYTAPSGSTQVDENTAFMLASVSKTITWTSLTMLYDQGKFDLDDPIQSHLSFNVSNPSSPDTPITFRHLYTHTATIVDDSDDEQYFWGSGCPIDAPYPEPLATTTASFLSLNSSWEEDNAPGENPAYSNRGTALAAVLVEEISGQPFQEYTQNNLFQILDMNQTSWVRGALPENTTAAFPYASNDDGVFHTWAGGYCFPDWPSGQLYSTASDMAKFAHAMLNNEAQQLYTTATAEEAFSSADTDTVFSEGSGLGWFTDGYPGGVGHNGGEYGAVTNLYIKTSSNVAVGWFANSELDSETEEKITEKLISLAEERSP
jgi:CubicO group peptidase (beta-lactamase class C family)